MSGQRAHMHVAGGWRKSLTLPLKVSFSLPVKNKIGKLNIITYFYFQVSSPCLLMRNHNSAETRGRPPKLGQGRDVLKTKTPSTRESSQSPSKWSRTERGELRGCSPSWLHWGSLSPGRRGGWQGWRPMVMAKEAEHSAFLHRFKRCLRAPAFSMRPREQKALFWGETAGLGPSEGHLGRI